VLQPQLLRRRCSGPQSCTVAWRRSSGPALQRTRIKRARARARISLAASFKSSGPGASATASQRPKGQSIACGSAPALSCSIDSAGARHATPQSTVAAEVRAPRPACVWAGVETCRTSRGTAPLTPGAREAPRARAALLCFSLFRC
jgi:hypothetical protein